MKKNAPDEQRVRVLDGRPLEERRRAVVEHDRAADPELALEVNAKRVGDAQVRARQRRPRDALVPPRDSNERMRRPKLQRHERVRGVVPVHDEDGASPVSLVSPSSSSSPSLVAEEDE